MKTLETDVVIVGTGLAGLAFALHLAERGLPWRCVILSKDEPDSCNTSRAQGGIALALPDLEDDPQEHITDTLTAGKGWCDEEVVKSIVGEAPRIYRQLEAWGVSLDRRPDGRPELAREGGHSRARVLHAGDRTGAELHRALFNRLQRFPNVHLFTGHFTKDLLVDDDGYCTGLEVIEPSGELLRISSRLTVLATGGAGQMYPFTTNPPAATGDGPAMALRAGLALMDMDFVQFHPTALKTGNGTLPLITEAIRGFGARLINQNGLRILEGVHHMKELAPRDVVSQAMQAEMLRHPSGGVFLDLRHLNQVELERTFPAFAELMHRERLDPARQPIPVVPAAHYICGGIPANLSGRTAMPGLLCLGESARTGLHGSNRLASNSLLEALATAYWAADEAEENILPVFLAGKTPDWKFKSRGSSVRVAQKEAADLLWQQVGILRKPAEVARAREQLLTLGDEVWVNGSNREEVEALNLLMLSGVVADQALERMEMQANRQGVNGKPLRLEPKNRNPEVFRY